MPLSSESDSHPDFLELLEYEGHCGTEKPSPVVADVFYEVPSSVGPLASALQDLQLGVSLEIKRVLSSSY